MVFTVTAKQQLTFNFLGDQNFFRLLVPFRMRASFCNSKTKDSISEVYVFLSCSDESMIYYTFLPKLLTQFVLVTV